MYFLGIYKFSSPCYAWAGTARHRPTVLLGRAVPRFLVFGYGATQHDTKLNRAVSARNNLARATQARHGPTFSSNPLRQLAKLFKN
jgi:hypothetical protein